MSHQYQYTIEKFKKVKAIEMSEDNGIWGKRFFPSNFMRGFDPFVLMDEIFVEPPGGIPTTVNKGFESITYVIDGSLSFREMDGDIHVLTDGGVQRIIAGKGVQHSFKAVRNGVNHAIRLWLNLPGDFKETDFSFQYLQGKDIPFEENSSKLIRKITGRKSPVNLNNKVQFKDVTLAKNSFHKFVFSDQDRGFVYVITGINGSIRVHDTVIEPGEGMFFENIHELMVNCRDRACRFIFVAGIPHGEKFKLKNGTVE
jgi:quercetin 2,3-dioxygenase